MLVCDTSGLLAFFDRAEPDHVGVTASINTDPGPFVVSPYVIAELDYLTATRRGNKAQEATLVELCGGGWQLAEFGPDDLRRSSDVIVQYHDQSIGVADASIVVLAARYQTRRVLTLDNRHFAVLRTLSGEHFEIVPDY